LLVQAPRRRPQSWSEGSAQRGPTHSGECTAGGSVSFDPVPTSSSRGGDDHWAGHRRCPVDRQVHREDPVQFTGRRHRRSPRSAVDPKSSAASVVAFPDDFVRARHDPAIRHDDLLRVPSRDAPDHRAESLRRPPATSLSCATAARPEPAPHPRVHPYASYQDHDTTSDQDLERGAL
jgi:hypothetical protein